MTLDQIHLHPIDPAYEPMMRSLNSNVKTEVTFINKRAHTVHLWWRDFEPKRVSYGTVAPNGEQNMTTYVTHAWVITDEQTGASLGVWCPAPKPGLIVIE